MSECFISVDVETAGPSPDTHALLSIGAVSVENMSNTFYVELQPDREGFDPETQAVHGFTLERLSSEGTPAGRAVEQFEHWVLEVAAGRQPVFVAYNAPFDWMYVNVYFHRYLGRNPFGHGALDMKALYMGLSGAHWSSIRHGALAARYGVRGELLHNALTDAEDQAVLFMGVLEESRLKHWSAATHDD
jgi:ribonuclease T